MLSTAITQAESIDQISYPVAQVESSTTEGGEVVDLNLVEAASNDSHPRAHHTSTDIRDFTTLNQFQNPRLGTRVVYVTDDFFGKASRILNIKSASFDPDRYDRNGKYMDGLESRRRRDDKRDHDYCIIQLGIPCVIKGVDIDTAHFVQNNAVAASLETCNSKKKNPDSQGQWKEILPKVDLHSNAQHLQRIESGDVATHVRLRFYPDGGIARLRLYGEVKPDIRAKQHKNIDLFALEHGGRALRCSNQHFGSMHHLNFPGRSIGMMDGWETGRRRQGGHDWVVLALGIPGEISKLIVQTKFFKGNYPKSVSVEAGYAPEKDNHEAHNEPTDWVSLLDKQPLKPDSSHRFTQLLNSVGKVSHLKMHIYPDGGISRLRVFGNPST